MQHLATFTGALLVLLATPICVTAKQDEKPNTLSLLNNDALSEQYAEYMKTYGNSNTNNNYNNVVNPNPAIIGGEEASDNEFPWFGRTEQITAFGTGSCAASLIYSDIAISVASCALLDAPLTGVKFNLGANQYDGSDGTVMDVELIIWPQNFSYPENDISFYKLKTSTTVPPVSWNVDPSFPNVGDIGTTIGFGLTTSDIFLGENSPILLKVDVPVISNEECSNLFEFEIPDTLVCTFAPGEGKSACIGDSGGPLLTDNGVMYGLTSYGYNDCAAFPIAYTRTSYFREYISKVICDYSANPPEGCVGFEISDEVNPPDKCGLFGLSFFCPRTGNGFFGRLFDAIFGGSS